MRTSLSLTCWKDCQIATGCKESVATHVIVGPHVVLLDLNVGHCIQKQLLWNPALRFRSGARRASCALGAVTASI